MGHNDPTDVDLTVDGVVIAEFAGIDDWATGHEASHNEGPGGRAYGFNTQRGNNKVSFTLKVRDTAEGDAGMKKMHELVTSQKIVAIKAVVVRNLDSYKAGQEIGLGAEQAVISGGSRSKGSGDAADVSFTVIGIGPIVERKA